MACSICNRLKSFEADPALVHEFENSILVVGAHQYYPGYCVLYLKKHVRELHDIDPELQAQFYMELLQATKAVSMAYMPWKINHASLGNVVGHVHWHIIPRYADDPQRENHPWIHEADFGQYVPTIEQYRAIAARIREYLS